VRKLITSIKNWGNSQAIRIPKQLLDKLNITEDDHLEITEEDNRIVIKKIDFRQHKTIEERFAEYDGEYNAEEVDWGKPEGKEIW